MAAKRKKQSKKAKTSPPKGREKAAPNKAASNKPASNKPASNKAASNKAASNKAASNKAASNKPASNKPASNRPASNKPASNKPAERSTEPSSKVKAPSPVAQRAATGVRSSGATSGAKKTSEPESTTRSSKGAKDTTAQQSLFDESGSVPAKGVGGKVPEFALNDQDGKRVTLSSLLGNPFVLYFYPKDDTPGCTKEACDFRDQITAFKGLGCRVVGVSPDSEASHKKFATKYGLDFTLLSDPDKALCTALGVWQLKKNYGREYMGVVRSTFVVQSDGIIARAFRGVKVAGHVPLVIEALKAVS